MQHYCILFLCGPGLSEQIARIDVLQMFSSPEVERSADINLIHMYTIIAATVPKPRLWEEIGTLHIFNNIFSVHITFFLNHEWMQPFWYLNPLGAKVFSKKCWILTSEFQRLVAWKGLKIEIYCKLEKCWGWLKVYVGCKYTHLICILWHHQGAALLNFIIFRK